LFLGAAPSQILPRGGGMGQPGCPIPLLEGCALPHPPAGGGVGQPGCPTPLAEGVCTRQAPCAWRTTPDANGPGARASRPRHGAAGTVTAPSLTFPPLEEGTRLLPPAGGGWEGGQNPANDFYLSRPCGSAPHEQDEHRFFLGGLRPPKPSQGPGPGCAGLRPASAEGWGNPVSPSPSSRAYVHVSRPCSSAAPRRNELTVVLGRAAPSQTLPGAGAWVRGPPARVR